jgi:hypothetical protein
LAAGAILCSVGGDAAITIFENITKKEQIVIIEGFVELVFDENDRKRLASLVERMKGFSTQRNKIVHASWGTIDGEPARFSLILTYSNLTEILSGSQKSRSHLDKHIFTVARIDKLTEEGIKLRNDLEKAVHEIRFPPGPRSKTNTMMMERRMRMRAEAAAHARPRPDDPGET